MASELIFSYQPDVFLLAVRLERCGKGVRKMKTPVKPDINAIDKNKTAAVSILLMFSIAIIASSLFFIAYSLYNNVTFKILNTNVSGVFFGLIVLYLGVRYFISVQKLKKEVYKPESKFSWSNFRK